MKRTCFYDQSLEAGAEMVEMFGYELPWTFAAGGEAEHVATRENVTFVDLGYMAHFAVTGPDSLKFIGQLLTADAAKLRDGQIMYSAICDESGTMLDDATIWKYRDHEYMLITGDEADEEWIGKQARGFDVAIRNETHNSGVLQVQGPRAQAHMKKMTGLEPTSVKYYNFRELTIDGRRVVVAKMSFTGSGGFEYHVEAKDARWLWDRVCRVGLEFGLLPIGQCALESLRQESGYLLVGNEHNKSVNPLEAGIAQVVKIRKPAFNGRQALLKAMADGIGRRIVWLKLTDQTVPETGDPIMLEGVKVGAVTSGSYSGTTKKGSAVGYVNVSQALPGQVYTVLTKAGERQAGLSLAPWYDPTHEIRRR
jgi:aminomethyltransferase